MYFVHLNNPTRQVRVDANSISVMEGFVTFSMRAHPEDYAPATVAVFRAEDVATVYNQDHIQSVIALPNVGSGSRIPFETTQRVEPSADYAPAIIRQGYTASSMDRQLNTATEARQYPPAPFVASWEDPIPTSDYPDPVPAPEPEVLNRAGEPVSFADRIRRNPFMPTRLPAIPLPPTMERALDRSYPIPPPVTTREPFRVNTENMMASTSGPRLYVTADEMISSAREQAMAAGENF
ncbi:hypothetical protein [Stenotrophomonas phage StenR_269]|nr:hypothetical protein [Stenotrophomonas phage StenR_269]